MPCSSIHIHMVHSCYPELLTTSLVEILFIQSFPTETEINLKMSRVAKEVNLMTWKRHLGKVVQKKIRQSVECC